MQGWRPDAAMIGLVALTGALVAPRPSSKRGASHDRALVLVGGGGAGPPPGTVVLWDDVSGTKKTLLGPGIAGSPDGVYGVDFDPTGTRIGRSSGSAPGSSSPARARAGGPMCCSSSRPAAPR